MAIYQRDNERRLRIGVVGVGSHSYRNLFPTFHYLPVELVAVCDLDEELAKKTAAEFGVPNVYTDTATMYAEADLEAVFICVSPHLHPRLAIEAMKAGVHAWTEKPAAARASQVEEMIKVRDETGLKAAVGYKKAYMPATQKAKELAYAEEFGGIRSIFGIYPMSIPDDGAASLESKDVSKWLADGCHPFSAMVSIGGPISEVTVMKGDREEADGVIFFKYESGATGTFHLTKQAPAGKSIERYDVFGESGHVISIENVTKLSYHRGIPFSYTGQTTFTGPGLDNGSVVWDASFMLGTPENKSDFLQGMYDEMNDFCQAILQDRPVEVVDLEFALNIMKVYEAALLSNGQPVKIQ